MKVKKMLREKSFENYRDELEERIFRLSLIVAIVISFFIFVTYYYYGMILDSRYGLAAFVIYSVSFQIYRKKILSYDILTRFFVISDMLLVLSGYTVSTSLLDGVIFLFLPAMATIILRPKSEAISIIVVYYLAFLLINLFGFTRVDMAPHLVVLIVVVDMIGLFFLHTYVQETRRLRYSLVHKNITLSKEVATDALTDIPNRKAFNEYIEAKLHEYKAQDKIFTFCLIDIDLFKQVNDTYGHDVGDKILKEVALMLKHSIREGDFIARYGGEEFAIFLDNVSKVEGLKMAERIKESVVNGRFSINEKITVSIGLSNPREEDSARELFIRADEALYKAKDNGRNRVEIL